MNKFLLGLNLVLVIAVGVLYYMYFDYTKSDIHDRQHAQAAAANTFKIAYFELDSLQTNYEYYKEVNDYQTANENIQSEMQAEMLEKLQGVKMKIQDFLKSYCANKGYAYVFASTK